VDKHEWKAVYEDGSVRYFRSAATAYEVAARLAEVYGNGSPVVSVNDLTLEGIEV
jgi:hypothetical protein